MPSWRQDAGLSPHPSLNPGLMATASSAVVPSCSWPWEVMSLLGQPASPTPLLLATIPDPCSAAFSEAPQTQRGSCAGHHHCFPSLSSFRGGRGLGLLWGLLPSCLQGHLPLDPTPSNGLESLGLGCLKGWALRTTKQKQWQEWQEPVRGLCVLTLLRAGAGPGKQVISRKRGHSPRGSRWQPSHTARLPCRTLSS